jgi:DNA-binding phage protein
MALTRDFKKTILERALKDPKFRCGLLISAVNEFLIGEFGSAKMLMRDYINATIGFSKLAKKLGKNDKTIQRMFSNKGNPTSENLCAILKILQQQEGIELQTRRSKNDSRAA